MNWTRRFAARAGSIKSSVVRELLKLTERPNLISFAGGLPAPELFPVERVGEACRRVLEREGSRALQYSTTEGYRPLREVIAARASLDGTSVGVEQVLITTGSQQALDLVGRLLIDPGDRIGVENPTYLGALQAWNSYAARYVPLPMDCRGLLPDALATAAAAGLKFAYVLPNFQNPTGLSMSAARRHATLAIAQQFDLAIVEDDPYRELRYDGESLPSLFALEAASGEAGPLAHSWGEGRVISLGSFSKILAPGLRLGWVIAPREVVARLVQAKQGADLHTSTFDQMIAHDMAADGFLDEHVLVLRRHYRERRDAMLSALERFFPSGTTWTHPAGGLFVWVTLPEDTDAAQVLSLALTENVAFVPGVPFFPAGGGTRTMRLNFSNVPPLRIEEGLARLGRVLEGARAEVRE